MDPVNFDTDIETVGQEIMGLMHGEIFASKLLSITAEKGDDIQLPNFLSRKYGWASMEAELPALYVMGLREELIKDDGLTKWVWFKYAIEVYATGADSQEIEKMTNRYARAVEETLCARYSDNAFVNGIDYAPVLKYEDALIKVCSIAFQVRILKRLI